MRTYPSGYFSERDEDDLQALLVCKKNGWIKSNGKQTDKCTQYLKRIKKRPAEEKSLFLDWLRTKVPLSPQVQILSTKTIRKDEHGKIPPYQLIKAKLDKTIVTFHRGIDEEDRKVEGSIFLIEINGLSIESMFKSYLAKLESNHRTN